MMPSSASISLTRCPFPSPPMAGLHDIAPIPPSRWVSRAVSAPIRAQAAAASMPACPPTYYDDVISSTGHVSRETGYFPTHNLENISPSTSSTSIRPVTRLKARAAKRNSSATNSAAKLGSASTSSSAKTLREQLRAAFPYRRARSRHPRNDASQIRPPLQAARLSQDRSSWKWR